MRLIWAVALLAVPGPIIVVLGGQDAVASRLVLRILGVRHLLQAGIELQSWPRWRRAGSNIDALHAASAAAFSVASRQWRHAALADASIAASFSLVARIDRIDRWA
jgi:hypothetical protein